MRTPRSLYVALSLLAPVASADVRLPRILSDRAVLQQNTEISLFGWAKPGEAVAIQSSWGAKAAAVGDPSGRFRTTIKTPAGGHTPHTLTFTGENTITLSDLLVGEVWICGGQSNMEWSVASSDGADEALKSSDDPLLRLFMVSNVMSLTPRADNDGSWTPAAPASVRDFSAVGHTFGKELRKALGVPVGLVSCDWGGTRAEAWMSESAIAAFPEFNQRVELQKLARDPNKRQQIEEQMLGSWWAGLDSKGPRLGSSWTAADFKDDAWPALTVPKVWEGELASFDGVVYHRVKFLVPAALAGKPATLSLGPIDDRDEAFVNGTLVGATRTDGLWNQPRTYPIPAGNLKAGENTLAVRVLDTNGLGGIFGKPADLAVTIDKTTIPLVGTWKHLKGPTKKEIGEPPASVNFQPYDTPSGLYNGMLVTIAPFTPRGAIWYQGESNRHNPAQYRALFPALITDWRSSFAAPDMAFLFVQLAPFRYGGDTGETALIREAQTATLSLPGTGMAVTMDIGNPADIHPRNKKDVGRRLSLWALAKTYGKDVGEFSGPLYKSASFADGRARVAFDHAKGLAGKGGPVTHVWIAGADKVFRPAESAKIEGETLVVSHPKIPEPKAVRYGWPDDAQPNLINAAGLPASPFRTDDWPKEQTRVELSAAIEDLRDKDPAFKPLFDGKSLAGWVNVNTAPESWTVAKDDAGAPIIRCTGKPTGVLRTDAMYENFVVELEWRHLVPGGNAGFFVWSDALTAPGVPFTRSVEVQVMDGQEGSWYTSDGDIFPIHGASMTPLTKRQGIDGDRAFPTERRVNPSPAWNHYRVECVNGSITLAVNGKVVTRGEKISPRKGYICLESEGSEVHFRNIRIKPLPSSAALDPKLVATAAEGWTPLYSGLDFRNWKHEPVHQGHWKAQDWVIDYDGKSGQDLWSSKSYKNFELIADWRFSGPAHDAQVPDIQLDGTQKVGPDGKPATVKVKEAGDSGIYLRGSSKSQVNIWCWPIGSGEVYGYRTDSSMSADVRKGVTPKSNADKPLGEWNRFHITMKGDRLTVVLNGVTVIENAQLPDVAAEGPIALQHHGDPIQFANIFIRELK